MRIIVHYGTAKTGSTALQQALHANREALRAQGVLYPKGVFTPNAHHILNCLYKPKEAVWPQLRKAFGDDEAAMRAEAEALIERIRREATAQGCRIVVLSSEMFFYRMSLDGQETFRRYLTRISDDIVPFVYVRSPAPYYLSGVQQGAKASGTLEPPFALEVRETMETIERAFGTAMRVRPFERSQLQDGDIVRDFLVHALESPGLLRSVIPGTAANESVSAEVMDILVRYARTHNAGFDSAPPRARAGMLSRLHAIEVQLGGARRPQLNPAIAAAVMRASVDALWLRETHGITFSDLDYAAIDGAPLDHLAGLQSVEELCVVDRARRDQLLFGMLDQAFEEAAPRAGHAFRRLYGRARRQLNTAVERATGGLSRR